MPLGSLNAVYSHPNRQYAYSVPGRLGALERRAEERIVSGVPDLILDPAGDVVEFIGRHEVLAVEELGLHFETEFLQRGGRLFRVVDWNALVFVSVNDERGKLGNPSQPLRRVLLQKGADFDALHRSTLTLRESFEYLRVAHPAPTLEALRPAMAHREQLMHAHVEYVIESLGPGEKLVLMGANDHLCKDVAGIRQHTAGVAPGGDKVPPIGTFVARRHPGQVFSIWLLYERGRDSQPFVSLGNDLRSPRGSLTLTRLARRSSAHDMSAYRSRGFSRHANRLLSPGSGCV